MNSSYWNSIYISTLKTNSINVQLIHFGMSPSRKSNLNSSNQAFSYSWSYIVHELSVKIFYTFFEFQVPTHWSSTSVYSAKSIKETESTLFYELVITIPQFWRLDELRIIMIKVGVPKLAIMIQIRIRESKIKWHTTAFWLIDDRRYRR